MVFDNLSSGHRDAAGGAELIEGDLRDPDLIGRLLKEGGFSAVLHFASLIQVGESFVDPRKYYEHNLRTSLNLLGAALDAGVRVFIFSSSAAVYGLPRETPIREDHPLDPVNPYGRTKAMIEQVLRDYDRAYGLKHVSLRYFNAAGADPDGELGERHHPETHLIPNVLRAAAGDGSILGVFGTDFPTADGTAVRDYIHVTDLASAHVLALRRLLDGGSARSSTWGQTGDIPSAKSSPPPKKPPGGAFPGKIGPAGKATTPFFWPRRKKPSASWDGGFAFPTSARFSRPPGLGTSRNPESGNVRAAASRSLTENAILRLPLCLTPLRPRVIKVH